MYVDDLRHRVSSPWALKRLCEELTKKNANSAGITFPAGTAGKARATIEGCDEDQTAHTEVMLHKVLQGKDLKVTASLKHLGIPDGPPLNKMGPM